MPSEQLCVNSITLSGTLEEKLAATRDAGFTAISLWEKDLRAHPRGAHEARLAVRQHGLAVPEFLPFTEWQLTAGIAKEAALRRAEAHFAFMEAMGFDTAVVVPTLGTGDVEHAVLDLQELADLAALRRIRLAYEFLAWAEWQRDIRTSWEIVERAERSNVGLTIDSFHIFKGGSTLEELRRIPVERMFIVHVVDAPDLVSRPI
jgi:4-hydroxyphenylpyruvate dioxygenase